MKVFRILLVLWMTAASLAEDVSSRIKRNILFPPEATMGIYLAVGFPIDLPQYDISWSYNFEANYVLPSNSTELAYGPQVRKARDLTRATVYSLLEERLETEGYLSRSCLLRLICDTSANTVLGHNGLLGELIHIILTPSSTEPEDLPSSYEEAEKYGLKGRENCVNSYPDCPVDLYEFFSVWSSQ